MTKIITHSGVAHLDDFLSTCLILHKDPDIDEIIRTDEVSEQDLKDKNIWKVDIGVTHDPDILAFDHHQETDGECSLSLILKYWDVWDSAIEVYSWLHPAVKIDAFGLDQFLTKHKMSYDTFFKLDSFIEKSFIELFQRRKKISNEKHRLLFIIMKQIGKQFFTGITSYYEILNNIESQLNIASINKSGIEEIHENGIPVILYLTKKPQYSSHLFNIFRKFKSKMFPNHHGGWISVFTYDRPKNSLYLKRNGSRSQIDFSQINSMEKTIFAHDKGFVAIVENMPEEELYAYIQQAIT